jgi:hypothetical protein
MLSGENEHVNEEVLKRAIFNLEILRSKWVDFTHY